MEEDIVSTPPVNFPQEASDIVISLILPPRALMNYLQTRFESRNITAPYFELRASIMGQEGIWLICLRGTKEFFERQIPIFRPVIKTGPDTWEAITEFSEEALASMSSGTRQDILYCYIQDRLTIGETTAVPDPKDEPMTTVLDRYSSQIVPLHSYNELHVLQTAWYRLSLPSPDDLQSYFGTAVALHVSFSKFVIIYFFIYSLIIYLWPRTKLSRDDLEMVSVLMLIVLTIAWETREIQLRKRWSIRIGCDSVGITGFYERFPSPHLTIPLMIIFTLINIGLVFLNEYTDAILTARKSSALVSVGSTIGYLVAFTVVASVYRYLLAKALKKQSQPKNLETEQWEEFLFILFDISVRVGSLFYAYGVLGVKHISPMVYNFQVSMFFKDQIAELVGQFMCGVQLVWLKCKVQDVVFRTSRTPARMQAISGIICQAQMPKFSGTRKETFRLVSHIVCVVSFTADAPYACPLACFWAVIEMFIMISKLLYCFQRPYRESHNSDPIGFVWRGYIWAVCVLCLLLLESNAADPGKPRYIPPSLVVVTMLCARFIFNFVCSS